MCDIINQCLLVGIFPAFLKLARTIPLFKKGDLLDIMNFRPISILLFISKIFEKCLHARISNFCRENQLFTVAQFGFTKGLMTADAVAELTEFCYRGLNSKNNVINVFY